jgi:hypothetical protein
MGLLLLAIFFEDLFNCVSNQSLLDEKLKLFSWGKRRPLSLWETLRSECLSLCLESNLSTFPYRFFFSAEKKCFVHVPIPLEDQILIMNNKINPGDYNLQFEVELPATLPSSMKSTCENGRCEIVVSLSLVPGSDQ